MLVVKNDAERMNGWRKIIPEWAGPERKKGKHQPSSSLPPTTQDKCTEIIGLDSSFFKNILVTGEARAGGDPPKKGQEGSGRCRPRQMRGLFHHPLGMPMRAGAKGNFIGKELWGGEVEGGRGTFSTY